MEERVKHVIHLRNEDFVCLFVSLRYGEKNNHTV